MILYRSMIQDSSRWNDFAFRPGDIVITTPPKCGTTWMQRICSLLVFQTPVLDRPLTTISPWLDMTTKSSAEVNAILERQQHRRFIKSHTPLDGLPIRDEVDYICVGRDARDAGISWYHHQANTEMDALLAARDAAVGNDDLPELLATDPPLEGETLEARFWSWVDHQTPPPETSASLWATLKHMEEALRHKDRPNVHLFHYSELKADLAGEMRRLAALLGIAVADSAWPELVESAGFEAMKRRADEMAPALDAGVWKDNAGFFHDGRGGGWRDFFDEAAQRRYDTRVHELATPETAAWVHRS